MDAIPADRCPAGRAASGTITVCASVLAGTFLLAVLSAPGIPCLFQAVFHVPCPGCGLTRSLKSIWTGDIVSSLRYHPLGIPLFAVCLGYLGSVALRLRPAPRNRSIAFRRNAWLAVLGLLIFVWAARLADRLLESGIFLAVLGGLL